VHGRLHPLVEFERVGLRGDGNIWFAAGGGNGAIAVFRLV
jgi:hypothetical protein